MPSRHSAIGILALLGAIAASRATSPGLPLSTRPLATPGIAHLQAFGSRSAQQRESAASGKLDAALADLHALNPAARFMQPSIAAAPLVLIDAVTRGDPQRLKTALQSLGLQ